MGRLAKAGGFAGFASFAFLGSANVRIWHKDDSETIEDLTISIALASMLQGIQPRPELTRYFLSSWLVHADSR